MIAAVGHFNMKTALYRAFIAPGSFARRAVLLRTPASLHTGTPTTATAPLRIPAGRNAFSTAVPRLNKYSKQLDPQAMPSNYEIKAHEVMIADNRGITGPNRTASILAKLNLEEFALRMVANPGGQLPICRVVHIETEAQRQKAMRMAQSQKLKKKSAKSIEINWNTTKHDLSYRMKQLAEFLNKGFTVTITLTRKRRKEQSTNEHIAEVTGWVREAVDAARGSITKEEFDDDKMTRRFGIERKSNVIHWNMRKEDPVYAGRQLSSLLQKDFLVTVVFSRALEEGETVDAFKQAVKDWASGPITAAKGRVVKDEFEQKGDTVSMRITVDEETSTDK
ncbi:hypothetical protein BROUX41_004023 [Berkeleyomyces rouxiae]|uniref:uncharacterized protein n=1 Tax=Berkeleyomyces rouxiae TaxID=2035830 RepID=UPI003B82A6CB